MARGSLPEAVAVLDVGKTNVKLLAVTPDGKILSSRSAPNARRTPSSCWRASPLASCSRDMVNPAPSSRKPLKS